MLVGLLGLRCHLVQLLHELVIVGVASEGHFAKLVSQTVYVVLVVSDLAQDTVEVVKVRQLLLVDLAGDAQNLQSVGG